MIKKLCIPIHFLCFFLLLGFSAYAQIVGGGSLQKPVASQLGGLVNPNVFKRLPGTLPKNKAKAPATNRTAPKSTSVSKSNKNSKPTTKGNIPKTSSLPAENFSILTFNPINNAGIDRELAETFSQNKNEQAAFLEIFKLSKTAYDAEVAKKGRKNDIAMAMTFFIATCVTVYHDVPEPTEGALENLYTTLADLMVEDGSIANSSNIDKQILHDRLIYISGLVLAGYTSAKQENDANTLLTFKLLAGICLKSLMELEPDNLIFDENGLNIKPQ